MPKPDLQPHHAEAIAREYFGRETRAKPLTGYAEQNFALRSENGERYLLKIAPPDVDMERFLLQVAVLRYLGERDVSVPSAQVVAALHGQDSIRTGTRDYPVFMLTWLRGELLAKSPAVDRNLLEELGRITGRLHRALEGFAHPGLDRHLAWDLRHTLTAREHLPLMDDPERRGLATDCLDRFEQQVMPVMDDLPQGVIHGDLNDYNILVDDNRIAGIIDFGDMAFSARVFDVAIAAAYAMFHTEDPVDAAAQVFRGYTAESSLSRQELALGPDLIGARLAFSVIMSNLARRDRPDDPYVSVSEQAATKTLALLHDGARDVLHDTLQGMEPKP